MRRCIDREEEIKLSKKLCNGETEERVLFVAAESGWGKSHFLREIIGEFRGVIPVAIVDYKTGALSFSQFLANICDAIGWEKFPLLASLLEEREQISPITIKGNIMIGANRIENFVRREGVGSYEFQQEVITRTFFEDLRALGRALIVIDVFENCGSLMSSWIVNYFIPHIQRSPQVSLIISGQGLPQLADLNGPIKLELKGIPLEHWSAYIKEMQIAVTHDWLVGCHEMSEGHPYKMLQLLNTKKRIL